MSDDEASPDKPNPEALMTTVGSQIRTVRKQQDVTIEELARRSGVSIGHISMIERGKGNPSFNTLAQLAHALGIALARLFHNVESASPVVRKNARRRLDLHPSAEAGGSLHELLTPSLNLAIEVVYVEEPPGYNSKETPFQHAGEEVGVILEGRHIIWLDGVPHELEAGDSISYPSTVPHWYENPGPDTVKAIWIISPPTF